MTSLKDQQQVSFIKTKASVLLDLVRGIAAILVLLQHWKIMFFIDYPKIPYHRIWLLSRMPSPKQVIKLYSSFLY